MSIADYPIITEQYFFPMEVPLAERNAEWAGDGARLVLFDRGDHNSIFHTNRAAYLEELKLFLDAIRDSR